MLDEWKSEDLQANLDEIDGHSYSVRISSSDRSFLNKPLDEISVGVERSGSNRLIQRNLYERPTEISMTSYGYYSSWAETERDTERVKKWVLRRSFDYNGDVEDLGHLSDNLCYGEYDPNHSKGYLVIKNSDDSEFFDYLLAQIEREDKFKFTISTEYGDVEVESPLGSRCTDIAKEILKRNNKEYLRREKETVESDSTSIYKLGIFGSYRRNSTLIDDISNVCQPYSMPDDIYGYTSIREYILDQLNNSQIYMEDLIPDEGPVAIPVSGTNASNLNRIPITLNGIDISDTYRYDEIKLIFYGVKRNGAKINSSLDSEKIDQIFKAKRKRITLPGVAVRPRFKIDNTIIGFENVRLVDDDLQAKITNYRKSENSILFDCKIQSLETDPETKYGIYPEADGEAKNISTEIKSALPNCNLVSEMKKVDYVNYIGIESYHTDGYSEILASSAAPLALGDELLGNPDLSLGLTMSSESIKFPAERIDTFSVQNADSVNETVRVYDKNGNVLQTLRAAWTESGRWMSIRRNRNDLSAIVSRLISLSDTNRAQVANLSPNLYDSTTIRISSEFPLVDLSSIDCTENIWISISDLFGERKSIEFNMKTRRDRNGSIVDEAIFYTPALQLNSETGEYEFDLFIPAKCQYGDQVYGFNACSVLISFECMDYDQEFSMNVEYIANLPPLITQSIPSKSIPQASDPVFPNSADRVDIGREDIDCYRSNPDGYSDYLYTNSDPQYHVTVSGLVPLEYSGFEFSGMSAKLGSEDGREIDLEIIPSQTQNVPTSAEVMLIYGSTQSAYSASYLLSNWDVPISADVSDAVVKNKLSVHGSGVWDYQNL